MIDKYNVLSIDCDWVGTLKHQTELLSFLIPILNKHDKIIFSHNHHDINKYFHLDFKECDLVNVDHHHDLGYNLPDNDLCLHIGNWLSHLIQVFPQKINYTWICNTNSMPIQDGPILKRFNNNIKSYFFDYNFNKLNKHNYNLIFICSSPEYNTELGLATYKILESIYAPKDII